MIQTIVFVAGAAMALGAGFAMVLARNAVHAALFLVVTQVALAILFLLQGAFFVAALQIIIYAGAIMVLFVFVVMLLGVDQREALVEPLRYQRLFAVGLAAILIAQVLYLAGTRGLEVVGSSEARALGGEGNVEAVARLLFTRWAFPFEATSVVLMVAVVGVMALAKRRRDE